MSSCNSLCVECLDGNRKQYTTDPHVSPRSTSRCRLTCTNCPSAPYTPVQAPATTETTAGMRTIANSLKTRAPVKFHNKAPAETWCQGDGGGACGCGDSGGVFVFHSACALGTERW